MKTAEAQFTEYFARNYPGPDTIIFDPLWHAPKLFRAARHAIEQERGDTTVMTLFQSRVRPWMDACFGPKISADRLERGDRLVEEIYELLQSGSYPRERLRALESYVWSRDVGEPAQEVGGVMVTLAAYCLAHDLDMHEAAETELARIWTKVEAIRAKQAAKPVGSALPIPLVASSEEAERCFICDVRFKAGDMVLMDQNESLGHRACFGEDREGYHGEDGGPLRDDEEIPEGCEWEPDTAVTATDDKPISLEPCPFCEGKATLRYAPGFGWEQPPDTSMAMIGCTPCGFAGQYVETAKAIAAWNRRASHPPAGVTVNRKAETLLQIIEAMGGQTDAGDERWHWLQFFCNDGTKDRSDTFNFCIENGWLRSTTDSDSDHSVAWITDTGRSVVSAFSLPQAAQSNIGVEAAWLELSQKDDRTSPAEYPDMCLISRDELAGFMGRALASSLLKEAK